MAAHLITLHLAPFFLSSHSLRQEGRAAVRSEEANERRRRHETPEVERKAVRVGNESVDMVREREGEIDIIGDGRPNLATCIMDPSGRTTD